MIRSFKHKGLRRFFETGSVAGIRPDQAAKLRRVLARLHTALVPSDLGLPGYRLHPLSGEYAGAWSVAISGNWRVIFRMDGHDALDVDYRDYH